MTQSIEFNELKQRAIIFSKTWQKKLAYLSDLVSRSGMDGAKYWLKSHHQIDQLKEAIEELLKKANQENFSLLLVDTTFSCFVLPEEDKGQAEWYLSAHNYLTSFQQSLVEKELFDKKVSKADGYKKKSYHQTGKAFDIYIYENGSANWDKEKLVAVGKHLIKIAKEQFNINLEHGANWTSWQDYPHFQIK